MVSRIQPQLILGFPNNTSDLTRRNSFSCFPSDSLIAESEPAQKPELQSLDRPEFSLARVLSIEQGLKTMPPRAENKSIVLQTEGSIESFFRERRLQYRRKSDSCSLVGALSGLEQRTADLVIKLPLRKKQETAILDQDSNSQQVIRAESLKSNQKIKRTGAETSNVTNEFALYSYLLKHRDLSCDSHCFE